MAEPKKFYPKRRAALILRNTTHNLSKHPLHNTWRRMHGRCYNPNDAAYARYGGRGIKICAEWITDFKAFFDWCMCHGWEKGLDIDRFPDNDGGYSPDNCRITTKKNNARNRSSNRRITYLGKTQTLVEWCEELDLSLSYKTILARLAVYGWHPEKALSIPIRHFKTKKPKHIL